MEVLSDFLICLIMCMAPNGNSDNNTCTILLSVLGAPCAMLALNPPNESRREVL